MSDHGAPRSASGRLKWVTVAAVVLGAGGALAQWKGPLGLAVGLWVGAVALTATYGYLRRMQHPGSAKISVARFALYSLIMLAFAALGAGWTLLSRSPQATSPGSLLNWYGVFSIVWWLNACRNAVRVGDAFAAS